jgi:hypothetical protein
LSGSVYSQQSTERYIPIGESPGVVDEETVVGEINDVDYETRSMQVRDSEGLKTVRMIASTRYYLDRTHYKRSNQSATVQDCRVGRKVEVKFYADGTVDWVKIESD